MTPRRVHLYACSTHGVIATKIVGVLPEDLDGTTRGDAIWAHVQLFDIKNYVVIDDVDDGISKLHHSHFVKTNSDTGLTLRDVENAARKLGG